MSAYDEFMLIARRYGESGISVLNPKTLEFLRLAQEIDDNSKVRRYIANLEREMRKMNPDEVDKSTYDKRDSNEDSCDSASRPDSGIQVKYHRPIKWTKAYCWKHPDSKRRRRQKGFFKMAIPQANVTSKA